MKYLRFKSPEQLLNDPKCRVDGNFISVNDIVEYYLVGSRFLGKTFVVRDIQDYTTRIQFTYNNYTHDVYPCFIDKIWEE